MELLKQMAAVGAEIVRGRIVNIGEDGKLLVRTDDGMRIACDFLRTNSGPLPRFHIGTPVLCLADETSGYVRRAHPFPANMTTRTTSRNTGTKTKT